MSKFFAKAMFKQVITHEWYREYNGDDRTEVEDEANMDESLICFEDPDWTDDGDVELVSLVIEEVKPKPKPKKKAKAKKKGRRK